MGSSAVNARNSAGEKVSLGLSLGAAGLTMMLASTAKHTATQKMDVFRITILKKLTVPFYPFIFVDCLRVAVRTDKGVLKKCVYTVLGVGVSGEQEVLGWWIEETEGARFWLKVFNDLKARGVHDALIVCGDGLAGLRNAVKSIFPRADVQLCVVHHIRNVTKFVSYKDRKPLCAAMQPIYSAPTAEAAAVALARFEQLWGERYPMSASWWRNYWSDLTTFFKYPVELRRIIYTTNAIESLHSQMRKNISNRKVFPHDNAVFKILFLNVRNFTNRWTKRRVGI